MALFALGRNGGTLQETDLCMKVWPGMSHEVFDATHYAILAAYAREEIIRVRRHLSHTLPGTDEINKMRMVIIAVQESADKHFEEIENELRLRTPILCQENANFGEILCSAASLVSMTKIRTREIPEPEPTHIWRPSSSLKTVMANVFRGAPTENPADRPINPKFTMSSLAFYHNCSVIWTDRLDRHLEISVNRGTRVISVYQHKIWLLSHLRRAEECMVPQDVLCEALDTLNLLFPHNNRQTESFLQKRGQQFHRLGYCGRGRKLNFNNYPHWGAKIEKLVDIFEGPRSGLWQFLPDPNRFNLVESANFWIAASALSLAYVGFVLGITSIVYAKWSYDIGKESLQLTRLQYQLSLAQACSDPEQAPLLPGFCPVR